MRAVGVLSVVALALVCFGQAPPTQPHAAPLTAPVPQPLSVKRVSPIDSAVVAKIESAFEQKVKDLDPNDPFDRLGACSGVYISGYGLVFTLPLSLVSAPTFGPFTGGFTPQKADAIHKRKLAHLPLLKKAMSEMALQASKAFPTLPPTDKVVVAARLFYLDYEDKTGLPEQIVVRDERGPALTGSAQAVIEEQ